MAYKPPKQTIVDNDLKYAPSNEAVFEALKLKLDEPSVTGTAGQLLQLDAYVGGEPTMSWINPPLTGANTTLSNLTAPTAVNQVLRGLDGTAAAPAYSFTADPDTGIYRSGNNILGISTNGTQSVLISGTRLYNGFFGGQAYGAIDLNTGGPSLIGPFGGSFSVIQGGARISIGDMGYNGDSPAAPTNSFFGFTTFFGTFGNIGGTFARPAQIAARHGISVNSPSAVVSQGMGMIGAKGIPAYASGQITSANASTTLTFSTIGNGNICGFIGIGDRIYLNGLSGTKATVTAITNANTVIVDTPLGDGTARSPWIERPLLNLYDQGGTRVFHVDYDGNTQINGGLKIKSSHAQAGTADVITVSVSDYYVGVDCSLAAKTVNLPAAATAGAGKTFVIKDETGSAATTNITIDANGAELIDGAATYVMAVNRESVTLVCDGTGWQII